MIDTGANMVIFKDPNLLSSFIASTGGVKGIGGSPMQIQGYGKLNTSFLPDSGKYPHVTEMDNYVYVPSYSFKIIPTQILITNLNTKGNLDVDYSKHDDTE